MLIWPVVRKIGEMLLDRAIGEHATGTMGDTLLECTLDPDDDEANLPWLHVRRGANAPLDAKLRADRGAPTLRHDH
jgi:hypothetical protein